MIGHKLNIRDELAHNEIVLVLLCVIHVSAQEATPFRYDVHHSTTYTMGSNQIPDQNTSTVSKLPPLPIPTSTLFARSMVVFQ